MGGSSVEVVRRDENQSTPPIHVYIIIFLIYIFFSL